MSMISDTNIANKNKFKEVINDYLFRKICKKEIFIVVGSESVKDDLINFYNIKDKKIIILPPLSPLFEVKLLEPF